MKVGDRVLRSNGKWTRITRIDYETKEITVYNFEVEGNHSYFVGDVGVLSHNCDLVSQIKTLASTFGKGECAYCAGALINLIKNKGGSGELIQLAGEGVMMSLKTGKVVATEGFHYGVRYGDMVYDNIHPNGIPYDEWVKDFVHQAVLPNGRTTGGTATVVSREPF